MQVIPSINEASFSEVAAKIKKAETFLPPEAFVHLDISDGIFTPHKTWNTPEELGGLTTRLNLEVHLMVQEPEAVLPAWLAALRQATSGKRRVIVHVEVMNDPAFILDSCAEAGAEAGLSFRPLTAPDLALVYLRDFTLAQVLAVDPGPSGQVFQESALSKIQFLRQHAPNVIIEVDGGMNPEAAFRVKGAGADAIVSGAYVWEAPLPKLAYEELAGI
ncbi:MAG: hypothetical protein Q7R85_01655 [bacterium]|nr:hypothetical protein [bacterium]